MALFAFLRRLRTVAYFMTHPAVPRLLKALPVIALAYMVFPRDLVVDFRAFGLIDDAVVVVLLLSLFTSMAEKRVARAGKAKQEAVPADFTVLSDDQPAPENADDGPDTDGPPSSDLRG